MHAVGATDFGQRLAGLAADQSLALLMGCELRLSSKAHSSGFSTLAPLAGACADQFSLELG